MNEQFSILMNFLITFANSAIKASIFLCVVLVSTGLQLNSPLSVLILSSLIAVLLPFPVLMNFTPDWLCRPYLDLFKHLVFGSIFGFVILFGYFLWGRVGLVFSIFFDLSLAFSPLFFMLVCFKDPPENIDVNNQEFIAWGIGGLLVAMMVIVPLAVASTLVLWLFGIVGFWMAALLSVIEIALLYLCGPLYWKIVSFCDIWNHEILLRLNIVPVHVRRFLVLMLITYVATGLFFGCAYYLLHALLSQGQGAGAIICTSGKHFSLFDMVYFSFITISTIGYGDMQPIHWSTKLLTIIEPIIGLGLLVFYLGWYLSSDKPGLGPGVANDESSTDINCQQVNKPDPK